MRQWPCATFTSHHCTREGWPKLCQDLRDAFIILYNRPQFHWSFLLDPVWTLVDTMPGVAGLSLATCVALVLQSGLLAVDGPIELRTAAAVVAVAVEHYPVPACIAHR